MNTKGFKFEIVLEVDSQFFDINLLITTLSSHRQIGVPSSIIIKYHARNCVVTIRPSYVLSTCTHVHSHRDKTNQLLHCYC